MLGSEKADIGRGAKSVDVEQLKRKQSKLEISKRRVRGVVDERKDDDLVLG